MKGIGTGIRAMMVAGLMGAVSSPVYAACITLEEIKADQVRFLDMQLRVAALRCRFENPKMTGLYNSFVRKHRGSIQASRSPVEGYLGRLSTLSMDRYVTKTANHISHKSMQVKNFCALNAAVARLAVAENDPLLVMDLLPVGYEAGYRVCRRDGAVDTVADADVAFAPVESIR